MRMLIYIVALAFFALIIADIADAEPLPPPQGSFVVIQCDELVVAWVITAKGEALRVDPEHHPMKEEEYRAFLKWLESAKQSDMYRLPCPNARATP